MEPLAEYLFEIAALVVAGIAALPAAMAVIKKE